MSPNVLNALRDLLINKSLNALRTLGDIRPPHFCISSKMDMASSEDKECSPEQYVFYYRNRDDRS
jgi:hypothetical protein